MSDANTGGFSLIATAVASIAVSVALSSTIAYYRQKDEPRPIEIYAVDLLGISNEIASRTNGEEERNALLGKIGTALKYAREQGWIVLDARGAAAIPQEKLLTLSDIVAIAAHAGAESSKSKDAK